jgi:hypothetical protein
LSSDEPSRVLAVVGALVLGVVLAAGIVAVHLLVDQPYRYAAIRLVAAAVLLVVLLRVRAFVHAWVERPTAWDEAPPEPRWAPLPHSQFEHFHDEIRFGARSQRYFDHVLWPRLCALAQEGDEAPAWLERPAGRPFGRGPSLEALQALVASLERGR